MLLLIGCCPHFVLINFENASTSFVVVDIKLYSILFFRKREKHLHAAETPIPLREENQTNKRVTWQMVVTAMKKSRTG